MNNTTTQLETLKDVERRMIAARLKRFGDNKTKAAKSLGISLKTLYNKLHRYGMFERSGP